MVKDSPSSTLPWLICFLSVFLISLFPITSSDLWWHLASGRQIMATGWMSTDPFSYPLNYKEWLNIHWLFQIVLWGVWSLGGLSLLAITKSILFAATWAVYGWRIGKTWNYPKVILYSSISVILIFPLRYLILARPTLLSITIATTMIVLLQSKQTVRSKALLLALLQILWANLQGLYILGPIILFAYLFSKRNEFSLHLAKWKKIAFILVSPLGLYSLVIFNPNHWKAYLYPFELWVRIKTGSGIFSTYITENQSLWMKFQNGQYVFVAAIGLSILLLCFLAWNIYTKKQQSAQHDFYFLLAIFLMYLAITSERNSLIYLCLCFPLIFQACEYGIQQLSSSKKERPLQPNLVFVAQLLLSTSIGLILIHLSSWIPQAALSEVSPGRFPTKNIAVLNQLPKGTKLFHADQFGGYLLFHTKHQTFIDGRFILRETPFLKEYFELFHTPHSFEKLQEKYSFEYALIPHQFQPNFQKLNHYLKTHPNWMLVSTDETSNLFHHMTPNAK